VSHARLSPRARLAIFRTEKQVDQQPTRRTMGRKSNVNCRFGRQVEIISPTIFNMAAIFQ